MAEGMVYGVNNYVINICSLFMNVANFFLAGLKCALIRRKLKKGIRRAGGQVSGRVKLTVGEGSTFTFGNGLVLNGDGITTARRMRIVVSEGGRMSFGDYSGISSSSVWCKKEISIGNHVNIGAECMIIDTDFHSSDWRDRADRNVDVQNAKSAPIHIGDFVFIGAKSIILKGVTIGDKSVIMAGSVVNRDVPANCIAGGNPCRILKQLP